MIEPPRLHGILASAHLQSALATLKFRRRFLPTVPGVSARPPRVVLDCGHGVRLEGVHERPPSPGPPRCLAILLHGWEGSVDSVYMDSLRRRLLAGGREVFRLNFRDHGATHALNPDLFHSCRLEEVLGAVESIARRTATRPVHLVGFSLGGNFALRVALHAPSRGIPVAGVVAVNPVIDPSRTLAAMEDAPAIYERHFVRKWRRSVLAKCRAFPDRYDIAPWFRIRTLREQTRWLIERFDEFDRVDEYYEGYSIADGRLGVLEVPATVISAADDPIIPVSDVRGLPCSPSLTVEIVPRGGHCGYLETARLRSWIDRRIDALLP